MPAPAVYVVAVVGTVAAGFAFKHFVYDPHIAPKVQEWKHEFKARREARRRRRAGPIPVAVDLNSGQRRGDKRSDSESDSGSDDNDDEADKQSYELETLVSKEVLEWRNGVDHAGTLRQRRPNFASSSSASGSSTTLGQLPIVPQNTPPMHVLFDSSSESSPMTSTVPTRGTSPVPTPQLSSLHLSTSRSTLRSPPAPAPSLITESPTAQLVEISPPTPAATSNLSFLGSISDSSVPSSPSPRHVPSLSLLHPVDLDHEHDVELLSAPSSRPDTPFSNFSHPSSTGDFSSVSADENPRTQPHVNTAPPGIQQQLLSPQISQSHSQQTTYSDTPSFYQTPIDASTASFARSQSDLEFLSFDGSQRSMSFDGFEDVRMREAETRSESEFGGSEISTESSWASVSDAEDPRDPARR
ncbi:hypothetical protein VNI00_010906 [Paramarasmius palmivorus]|uniref:Transmembrane protein n=1 Tax=Paramarasmius palmivorus TaxID=297713 RepID=A0AAW0CF63_9AGAR